MGRTDTEQEERVLNPRKDFTITISGSAEYDAKEESPIDFDSVVNMYFRIHKEQLTKMFNELEGIMDKSVLKNFHFERVDKITK